MTIEQTIQRIMSDILGVDAGRIGAETEMKNTSEWDSLRHMQLVLAVEQHFNVGPLSAEEIVAMTKFATITDIVKRYTET